MRTYFFAAVLTLCQLPALGQTPKEPTTSTYPLAYVSG